VKQVIYVFDRRAFIKLREDVPVGVQVPVCFEVKNAGQTLEGVVSNTVSCPTFAKRGDRVNVEKHAGDVPVQQAAHSGAPREVCYPWFNGSANRSASDAKENCEG